MLLYHKGTKFLANHNKAYQYEQMSFDVIIPQRYKIFSKSQRSEPKNSLMKGCYYTTKVQNF